MTSLTKLRFIHLLAFLTVPLAFLNGFSYWLYYSLFWYFLMQIIGVAITLHRLLSHKAFRVSPPIFYGLTLISVLSCMGSPLSWAGVHRLHHKTADTDKDPHSPLTNSFWSFVFGLYHDRTSIPPHMVKDLIESSWLKFLHRNYFKIIIIYILILLLSGKNWFLYQFSVPLCLTYIANTVGNFLNHTYGYRNHPTPDRSVNSWVLSLYTFGDGWHNNHHYNPNNWNHQHHWWEIDLSGWIIRFIKNDTTK